MTRFSGHLRALSLLGVLAISACGAGAGTTRDGWPADRPSAPDPSCQRDLPSIPLAGMTGSLPRQQVVEAMARAKTGVLRCYDHFKRAGVADVRVDVAANGTITRACALGALANTEEARCIEAAVYKFAAFPVMSAPLSLSYPYALR
jgi:hypothetical protein